MATEDNWETILRTKRSEIHRLLELDNGLHGELIQLSIFTKLELCKIWPAPYKRVSERIEDLMLLLEKKTFKSFANFCTALKQCSQDRVLEVLSKPGGCEFDEPPPVTNDCRNGDQTQSSSYDLQARCTPVCDLTIKRMRRHWNDIVEKMRIDAEVIGKLKIKRAFSEVLLNDLKNIKDDPVRNEEMLQLLEKGSEYQYDAVCEALVTTGQEVIVSYLKPPTFHPEKPGTASAPGMTQYERLRFPRTIRDLEIHWPDLKERRFGVSTPEFLAKVKENVMNETAYQCDSPTRGRAVIISNEFFVKLSPRSGTEEDEAALDYLFQNLKFKTVWYRNQTYEGTMQILQTESHLVEHRDYDMFVLFFLSHGVSGHIYSRDEKKIAMVDIMTQFDGKHCSYLVNKPKLFFIQACQGDMKTRGVIETDGETVAEETPVAHDQQDAKVAEGGLDNNVHPKPSSNLVQSDAVAVETVHEKADMLLANSTVEGYVSYRRPGQGTFFVQCLLDVFSRKAHEEDLQSMLTEVYNQLHRQAANEPSGNFKQIGERTDRLRKKVYLIPKIPDPLQETKSVSDDKDVSLADFPAKTLEEQERPKNPDINDVITPTEVMLSLHEEHPEVNDVITQTESVIAQASETDSVNKTIEPEMIRV